MENEVHGYAPDFPAEEWSSRDRFLLDPFATGLDGHVHVLRGLPPEIVGALCSRASRAKDSLLRVLLNEYFYPILAGEPALAEELESTVRFLGEHGFKNILNNQRAQAFYAKWLSQYGDDSIAQMTGTHLVFWGISQVAMKFVEDQRIGLEPIEKSTRYVNFGGKVGGHYLYYVPVPDLERLGLLHEYSRVLDGLFDTYVELLPELVAWLKKNYDDKESVLEKKAFDTLRGLLPMATLGQVAFRGNAQAFEYLLNRTAQHELGELRWISSAAKKELDEEIPSLLLRSADQKTLEYQRYLVERREKMRGKSIELGLDGAESVWKPQVRLVECDEDPEAKIAAALLFPASHLSWDSLLDRTRKMPQKERKEIFDAHLSGRQARWYKVGRAFENSYMRFEIVMNIGAYRDLHRHRMLTQERQRFSIHHGYDVPSELAEAGLENRFRTALDSVRDLFIKLEGSNPEFAQYVVPLAYRMRFYQWKNVREVFWETELRTISQGHPDYRSVEQEKFRLIKERLPLVAEYMQVDMKDYPIARRGTEERIAEKEEAIRKKLEERQ